MVKDDLKVLLGGERTQVVLLVKLLRHVELKFVHRIGDCFLQAVSSINTSHKLKLG